MRSSKQIGLIVLVCALAAGGVATTYFFAAYKTRNDIRDAGARQLQIMALDLETVLEKFETLPFAVAFHPDVAQALAEPGDSAVIGRLNLTLQRIQRQAKVGAIYLMDRSGKTLASSNWNEPLNYVGKNYGFRPYYRQALGGQTGRFYGIGSTTNEPGYFIGQPVYPGGVPREGIEPIGVMAVKIVLSEFEETWRRSEEPIALADRSGVVFLSNRADRRVAATAAGRIRRARGTADCPSRLAIDAVSGARKDYAGCDALVIGFGPVTGDCSGLDLGNLSTPAQDGRAPGFAPRVAEGGRRA